MRTFSDGQSEIFDAVAVIQAFMDDKTRCQLELPNLTAVQRKQTKSVVEMNVELTCESFGFGTERQLHIFKKSSGAVPQVSREGASEFHLASINERPCETFECDRSTSASASTPETGDREILAELGQPAAPPLPRGLSVRNTFIDVEDEHADNREVQSMPHGMFGHYLKRELSERTAGGRSTLPSISAALDVSALIPGTPVVIDGLQKCPAFNGSTGTVQSFDQESGRYSILLTTPASGHQWAKVKPENIKVLSPPTTSKSSVAPFDDHSSGIH
jgi:hypothetical protein